MRTVIIKVTTLVNSRRLYSSRSFSLSLSFSNAQKPQNIDVNYDRIMTLAAVESMIASPVSWLTWNLGGIVNPLGKR